MIYKKIYYIFIYNIVNGGEKYGGNELSYGYPMMRVRLDYTNSSNIIRVSFVYRSCIIRVWKQKHRGRVTLPMPEPQTLNNRKNKKSTRALAYVEKMLYLCSRFGNIV